MNSRHVLSCCLKKFFNCTTLRIFFDFSNQSCSCYCCRTRRSFLFLSHWPETPPLLFLMIPIGSVKLDWKRFRFQMCKNLSKVTSAPSDMTSICHIFSQHAFLGNCTRTKRVVPSRSSLSFWPNRSQSHRFSRTVRVLRDSLGPPAFLQNTAPNIFSSDGARCHIIHHRTNFLLLRCSSSLAVSAGPSGRSANPPQTCSR